VALLEALVREKFNPYGHSVVTRTELLTREGLRDRERAAIVDSLRRFRVIPVPRAIAARHATDRLRHPCLETRPWCRLPRPVEACRCASSVHVRCDVIDRMIHLKRPR
jgi:hypothetical protein